MHRSHGKGIGVVAKVEEYTVLDLFDAEDTYRTGRVAVLDTRMTWSCSLVSESTQIEQNGKYP
jgi:hypothetical protein